MGLDDTLVKEIVRRILSAAAPDKIILFGSAAGGGMTRDSDIDILIVEDNPEDRPYDRRKESLKIDETLDGLGYPFDVIVISSEWFEASKDVIGGIAYPAHKYGRVIYEAA
jgi:predicted nucleotidyltransferase